MVYRKGLSDKTPVGELLAVGDAVPTMEDIRTAPLSPDMFYPLVAEEEMVAWTHWLPTSFVFNRTHAFFSSAEVITTLTRLKAPPAVMEEFHWTLNMDLFEAYEVCTPVRRDARDPLLIGIAGDKRYRIALWGESLLPMEKISELVRQSLVRRRRAFLWRVWLMPLSALAMICSGIGLATGIALQNSITGHVSLVMIVSAAVFVSMMAKTPENIQHDFLDRYRC
ncbi:MAG: hypothetical protein HYT41_02100 [Candidatus Sungbacteria bacterium]|nr:hypothetical protein [Candidatus Sungbacteria bacterium]